jgi:hypothetical protein
MASSSIFPRFNKSVAAIVAVLFAAPNVRSAIEPTPGDRQALAEFREVMGGKIQLDNAKKIARVGNFCERIDVILPMLDDPAEMLQMAKPIVEFGLRKDVNNLEFLGEQASIQRHMKPIADALMQLLDSAEKITRRRADGVTNNGRKGKDSGAAEWEKLDGLARVAAYTRDTVVYFDCMAIEPHATINGKEGKAVRAAMALEAIKHLSEFDDPDSGLQPRIRDMIAKLYLAAGEPAKARQLLATVRSDPPLVRPAPSYTEVFDAKFFTVVADVQAEDLTAAIRDKQSLDAWETQTVPALLKKAGVADEAIAANLRALATSSAMLKWRVLRLKAKLAKDETARAAAVSEAAGVLIELRKSRPDLTATLDLYDPLKSKAESPPPGTIGAGTTGK